MDAASFSDGNTIEMRNRLTTSLSEELGSFIKSRSSTFACGGSIPITSIDNSVAIELAESSEVPTSPPVTIRWDSNDSPSRVAKLRFPVNSENKDEKASLCQLIEDCQPASFGYRGKNVLDEAYRKAIKMDRSAFSSDFCPYELGIIDTIAQVLMPNAGKDIMTKGVRAELYKMNIYAAPSGLFKSHVDTPRSTSQFGSLVVSLPCYHEGGQLIVRHAEHSQTFDWSASGSDVEDSPAIKWAAFYSDCEHEVLNVTAGHRVTLTYNLYFMPGVGDLAGNSPAMEVRSLPLYGKLKEVLGEEKFMHNGGQLGIYCEHAYAHSTAVGAKALPFILKGSDMAVYSIFLALGLKISVCPILDHKDNEQYDNYREYLKEVLCMEYNKNQGPCIDPSSPSYTPAPDLLASTYIPFLEESYVGRELGEVLVTRWGGEDDDYKDICEAWDGDLKRVNWLTEPKWREKAIAHMTYGNEAGIGTMYSHAAMVVEVPPASRRGGAMGIGLV